MWEYRIRQEQNFDILWFGIKCEPTRDEIYDMLTMFERKLTESECKLALHIQNIGEKGCSFLPSYSGWIPVVTWLMTNETLIRTKLQGTVIQAHTLSNVLDTAIKSLFLVYKHKRPFSVLTCDPTYEHFVNGSE